MPFSLQATTPGVRANRKGSSCPVRANVSNCLRSTFDTAKGAFVGAFTAITTTSCRFSIFTESCFSLWATPICAMPIMSTAKYNLFMSL